MTSPLHVLLVGLAASHTLGGGYTYVHGLASALRSCPGLHVTLLVPLGSEYRWHDLSGLDVYPVPVRQGISRMLFEYRRLGRLARALDADLVHFPHEWCPPSDGHPVIITWQNLTFIDRPLRGPRPLRNATYRALSRTAARAAGVIAVSRPVECMLNRRLPHRNADRIRYIPEGTDIRDHAPGGQPGQTFVLVAEDAGYKNHAFALDVWTRAREAGLDGVLHVFGCRIPLTNRADVVYRGWVPREELLLELRRAKAMLFPSATESFGLPALESLEAGCPALVMAASTMAWEFQPYVTVCDADPQSWVRALMQTPFADERTRLVSDETRSQISARYSWDAVARQTAQFYWETVEGTSFP